MLRTGIASILVCAALLAPAASAQAKPVVATCGGRVTFGFDDALWQTDKPLTPPPQLCDLIFAKAGDRASSLYLWAPPLQPAEATQVAAAKPNELLQKMVDMTARGNAGPKVARVQQAGAFDWAEVHSEGPSGKPSIQHVAVSRQQGILLYVVHNYEPARAAAKASWKPEQGKAELLAWLAGIQVGPAKAEVAAPPNAPTKPETSGPAGGRWLRVTQAEGKALQPGAGVRLRADGYDTAERGKGSTMATTCSDQAGTWTCEGGLTAVADGKDQWKLQLGPITLTAVPASAEEAARYDQWLADTQLQQATCRAAAACCKAAEAVLGACDLKGQLGDRSLAACRAGLDRLRSGLQSKKAEIPESCREVSATPSAGR